MSSEFYFRKWRETLKSLEKLVDLDVNYQTTKAHDKTRCEAVLRLSAVLGQYMTIYNHVVECLHLNLQVQKTGYMQEALDAIVERMMELKLQISKLDGSEYLFLSNGLIHDKNTTYDAELTEIPHKEQRPIEIKEIIGEATERANERIRLDELEKERGPEEEETVAWWDGEDKEEAEEDYEAKKKELTEEEKEIKRNVELIQSQERTRKVVTELLHAKLKRQMWTMELEGTAAPKPRHELRERSAKIIQKAFRAYFECKRNWCKEFKRDELLGIRTLVKPKKTAQEKVELIKARNMTLKEQFEKDWKSEYELIKDKYLKHREEDICESYRDYIRDWFYKWFEEIKLFYDIPDDNSGGSKMILREELPTPDEYLELYKAYLAERKANKGKSAQQKKLAKLEAKRQAEMEKKLEQQKVRQQNELKRKLLKNPSQHPGYDFPESKKTDYLLKVIEDYHTEWDEYDNTEERDVKEKHCVDVDKKRAIMEVKLELIPKVDVDMRVELKKLKAALKKDYINNEEEYPEPMKQKRKKKEKKPKQKAVEENIAQKMEDLVYQGFVKEYPRVKLQDFIGDPNFFGEDARSNPNALHRYDKTAVELAKPYLEHVVTSRSLGKQSPMPWGIKPLYEYFQSDLFSSLGVQRTASPYHGESRRLWWESCQSMTHGFHKTLLVGPLGSGKTVLMHALASLNDAVLFEVDPSCTNPELISNVFLQQVAQDLVTCARAAQPAVIHIKHVHRLYYKKVPPFEKHLNLPLFKRNFTKKLFKKIQKTDNITVIGSCVDPWMTKSKQMLKDFSHVVLMPNTSYSTVVQLLNDWVISNHVVPSDLNVSSLAQVLKGYSYGYLKEFLQRFLNGDRVAKISSQGLCPKEMYECLLEENVEKPDYPRFLKWYADMTAWGKREQSHLQEQREFKQALDRWALKQEMEKKKLNK